MTSPEAQAGFPLSHGCSPATRGLRLLLGDNDDSDDNDNGDESNDNDDDDDGDDDDDLNDNDDNVSPASTLSRAAGD